MPDRIQLAREDVPNLNVGLKEAQNGASQGSSSAFEEFFTSAKDSFKYSLIQAPATAGGQIIDAVAGTQLAKKAQFWEVPKPKDFGSAGWFGEVAGTTAGMALPFVLMHRMAGPGAAARLETTTRYGLMASAKPLARSLAAGTIYSGLLTPTPEGEDLLTHRLKTGLVGGVTFSALTAGSIGLKSIGNAAARAEISTTSNMFSNNPTLQKFAYALRNDALSTTIASAPVGILSADAHSLINGHGPASWEDRLKSGAAFTVGGAMMGGANIVHERFFPTSGIKGARDAHDLRKMADALVVRQPGEGGNIVLATNGRPPGYDRVLLRGRLGGEPLNLAEAGKTNGTGKLYASLADDAGSPHWMEAVDREFHAQSSNRLSPDNRKLVSSGMNDLAISLETIDGIGPIFTIYGSARLGPETFQYQRARLLANLLAREGYAVMTGGGPGIMEAANRGAFEAGGQSIGIDLYLPWEQAANPYLTVNLKHVNFFTRKEILRKSKGFAIEEGGLGTADEGFELLTHIQTGKMPHIQGDIPVYMVGERFYKPLDQHFIRGSMLRTGTISKTDLDLYKIMGDPFKIVRDLRHRRLLERAAEMAPQAAT